jgi:hypothetical protein
MDSNTDKNLPAATAPTGGRPPAQAKKARGRPKVDKDRPPAKPLKEFDEILDDMDKGHFNICEAPNGHRMVAVCPGFLMFCILCVKQFRGFASAEKHYTQDNCPNYKEFMEYKLNKQKEEMESSGSNCFVILNPRVSCESSTIICCLTEIYFSELILLFPPSLFVF